MIVASLSDSLCSARQRGKGVSERSELAPCILYCYIFTTLMNNEVQRSKSFHTSVVQYYSVVGHSTSLLIIYSCYQCSTRVVKGRRFRVIIRIRVEYEQYFNMAAPIAR